MSSAWAHCQSHIIEQRVDTLPRPKSVANPPNQMFPRDINPLSQFANNRFTALTLGSKACLLDFNFNVIEASPTELLEAFRLMCGGHVTFATRAGSESARKRSVWSHHTYIVPSGQW